MKIKVMKSFNSFEIEKKTLNMKYSSAFSSLVTVSANILPIS